VSSGGGGALGGAAGDPSPPTTLRSQPHQITKQPMSTQRIPMPPTCVPPLCGRNSTLLCARSLCLFSKHHLHHAQTGARWSSSWERCSLSSCSAERRHGLGSSRGLCRVASAKAGGLRNASDSRGRTAAGLWEISQLREGVGCDRRGRGSTVDRGGELRSRACRREPDAIAGAARLRPSRSGRCPPRGKRNGRFRSRP